MNSIFATFAAAVVLFLLVMIYCAYRISSKSPSTYPDLRPGKNSLFTDVVDKVLTQDRAQTLQPSTDSDGPTIFINTTRVKSRKYAPYQAALLQQIEALLPITAEEDVENVFSEVLLVYKKLGYNVENADDIIAQFRKGQHPPVVERNLVNSYV